MERKVLFTASTYSHICNFHLPYLKHFQTQGWTVHVACGGKEMALPGADKIIHLPFEKKMGSPSNFKATHLLRKTIADEGYELITTHTSLASFFTRLALVGMRKRPRVVNMVHGYLFDDDTPKLKRQVLLAAERLMAPYTDLLLTMNWWDHSTARRYQLGKKIVKVPGIGVDFSRLDDIDPDWVKTTRSAFGIPEDGFVLFYAAEFSSRKSQSVLIHVMERLPENVFLILAGEGALMGECWDLVRSLELTHRVILPGHVSGVGKWYAMSDAAVSSSRSEGLPFNIMEAMYTGLPVVASSVKGHEDLIQDEKTGLLYPYGDADACATQILRLLHDPLLRENLARQARESVLAYSLDKVFPVVTEQYESLVSRNNKS